MDQRYAGQDRGSAAAYAAYFAGMDASMRQKVALAAAYLPSQGRVADLGSGSGATTHALASLYPQLELIGVDIDPVAVAAAAGRYQLPNLSYVAGDITTAVFPPESLDALINSSVLHHVTSYNGFSLALVHAALRAQTAALRPGGTLIIRDFVVPGGPETVLLDLPETDGAADGDPAALSSAALFGHFARDWRSSVNPDGPVPYEQLAGPQPGWATFRVAHRAVAEFLLRKDYREAWRTELQEEYCYLSQPGFEVALLACGLRLICTVPVHNPWIIANRFAGKCAVRALDGTPLPYPATNILTVAQKVTPASGVVLTERASRVVTPRVVTKEQFFTGRRQERFLGVQHWRNWQTGELVTSVERPGDTVDLIPWFRVGDQVRVLAKQDFPRPVINAGPPDPPLGGAQLSGYLTEPISYIDSVMDPRDVRRVLRERAGVGARAIVEIEPGLLGYLPSPGGIVEQVESRFCQIRPQPGTQYAPKNYTSLSQAGTVRDLDAQQVLRACQVGGMQDARLELNIYALLAALGADAGPWIGAAIAPQRQAAAPRAVPLRSGEDARYAFTPTDACSDYLQVHRGMFAELDAAGKTLAETTFEYVLPQHVGRNTILGLPLILGPDGPIVGLEVRAFPAAQTFHQGEAYLAVAPAWRLPRSTVRLDVAEQLLTSYLLRDFGLGAQHVWPLGGPYFPSPGVTPEIVTPYVIEVDAAEALAAPLRWVALRDLVHYDDGFNLPDMHTLIAAERLNHALR